MSQYSTIAELQNFIVLDDYTKKALVNEPPAGYQTEAALEHELIEDLQNQGYEYLPNLVTPNALLANVREQLQTLNNTIFTDEEWLRFVEEYLDCSSDNIVDKTRKIQNNYIYDFVFDNGRIQNIYLVDKENVARNKVQVINQFEQTGSQANRYDVTILVNGLPMIQVELKKRGVAIREAFNQVHRYSKESFNSECSLFKYLQIFVISNGTDTRYFANTLKRNKNSFDFTMNWARYDNTLIKDIQDFTATFFQKNTLLQILLKYSVFDTNDTLLIMRPYQIAATERILWKIKSSYNAKKWGTKDGGGYIWHTTGSGKTLTSFKASQLATQLEFLDKVFFVVDRKDLDYQTMKEYQRFSPNSVNGSVSTSGLKDNIESEDDKIIVTTIQKLNNLMKSEDGLEIYQKQVVFIFDECHRSQFGEAQKNLKRRFKKFYQFGFTGTPIFPENASGEKTTEDVFGAQLHSYVITDAIRDEKVLKFKVDYNDVRPTFKNIETEQDEVKLSAAENNKLLLHPDRIKEISKYILQNFRIKTHRNQGSNKGFNAMFAVNSVEAAKLYYKELNKLQEGVEKPIKIATIFSFAPNEEQDAIGDIHEENFEPSAMDLSSKEFLSKAIDDYNTMFRTNYGIDSKEFQNYYRDLAKRVQGQEIDLLIVVGMFLTGFDAPTLNTLFVDKNLRYHGLMQAFSRTNRIYDATKTFGNIVTFRNLEEATIEAIQRFAGNNTRDVVLEKSYKEYLEGFTEIANREARKGYIEVVKELNEQFPITEDIKTEDDKKSFVKLFGEYLQIENILQNYDEFTQLKAFQLIEKEDDTAIEAFKKANFLTDEDIAAMKDIDVLKERTVQDYRSMYNDIRDWLTNERASKATEKSKVDWDDVVFEVDLLKSQEIDVKYILEIAFENNKKVLNKETLIDEIRVIIRASIGNRAKEGLIVDFIKATDLDSIADKASIISAFDSYAQKKLDEKIDTLISDEKLNNDAARRYIETSLKRRYASENGTDLNEALPKMSPLNPQYLTKKQSVFKKIVELIEIFKDIPKK
ncbi:type I restriction endonuclease subunit R [Prevotella sp.]|uniref:type I restriction endonuclease subunit R n=1 Tax=Prevotella sp. TaxID=59823 RepID=UPI003DA3CD62